MDEARISITERSLGLGESTIPSRVGDFTTWVERTLSEQDDADAAEVTVRFDGDPTVDEALAFLEGVRASEGLRTDVSEVTLVLHAEDD